MFSFKDFANEILIVEAIKYTDRTLFRPITEGKFDPKRKKNRIIKEGADDVQYLDNDQEIELIKTYQENPTSKEGLDALNRLVENKMPYIYSKVNKFFASHWRANKSDRDDMVQNASIALTKAIENFDVNSNNIFNAYATKCIAGAIMNTTNTSRGKSIANGKHDTKGNHSAQVGSLDEKISGSRGEWADKDSSVSDTVADSSPMGNVLGSIEDSEKEAALADWIKQLPDTEQTALKMYYMPENGEKRGATLAEIGKKIDMTPMGVKKLLDRVVTKLKGFADDQGYN